MPHEVRCVKCRRILLNPVEREAVRCFECRDPAPRALTAGDQWEELLDLGRAAVGRLTRSQWELGDLAIRVLTGRQGEALADYAQRIGIAYKTLQRFRLTAAAFPSGSREPSLSYSHHEEIAGRADRFECIKEAAAERWSIQQMLENIMLAHSNPAPRGAGNPLLPDMGNTVQTSQSVINSEPPSITNHDTAPVSAAQRVEDILERVPEAMATPVVEPQGIAWVVTDDGCWEWVGSSAAAKRDLELLGEVLAEIGELPAQGETPVVVIVRLLRMVYNRDHHPVG